MKNCERWTIAYRKRAGGKILPEDLVTPFTVIPNDWRYWRADPFLFEAEGKTFLFAEMFDRVLARGVIGCCEITENGVGKWTEIINEPFHLSYPLIFRNNGAIYMIPESFRAKKIVMYKAVSFPFQWEKVKDLKEVAAVDSTLVDMGEERYLITVKVENAEGKLTIYDVDDEMNLTRSRVISEHEDDNVRPAGNVFYWGDRLIRPTQDCSQGYGCALNFAEISELDKDHFVERILCKVKPSQIKVGGIERIYGIHTYNFTDKFEVIDYKQYEFGVVGKVAKMLRKLKYVLSMRNARG